MYEEQSNEYSDVCKLLKTEIDNCSFRIAETESNQQKLNNVVGRLDIYKKSEKALTRTLAKMKPMMESLSEYITERRKSSFNNLNNALSMAGQVIPSSSSGIEFKFDDTDAWLQTSKGTYADDAEGSGYKGTASVFVRGSVLSMNSDYLQTLILDEPFSKVAPENSVSLSSALPVLCQDKQVILIEQKPEVYANVPHITYEFFKEGAHTVVMRGK